MTEPMQIDLVVNGKACSGTAEPRRTLADFLRDDLRFTGTHVGCEHGVCGACTVRIDGVAARARRRPSLAPRCSTSCATTSG